MALSTLTRYLRLRVRTDLSLPASQNLQRLDSLGFTFAVDENDNLEVRSRGNLVLKPEATEVGGAGSGGELHLGSANQPVDIKVFATGFSLRSALGIENPSGKKVSLAVASGQSSDKTLTMAVPGNVDVTFGHSGNIVTDESAQTLVNKSISGASNLISNINYSSLVGSPDGTVLPSYSGNGQKYLRLNSAGTGLEWSTLSIPEGYTDADADARVEAGIAAVKAQPNGLASLGSDGKVPSAQLPSAPVTSVNGQTGAVSLSIPTQYTDGMADSRVSAGIAALKGAANGLASLDASGKLPTSQLPSLAITSTTVVNSEAAMLALSAEEGDVAIRTDNGKTYILAGDPTSLASWKEVTAGGAVTSVNGQTGTVSLSTTDVSEGTNKYYTLARVKSEAISSLSTDADQNKAPSITLLKGYAVSKSGFYKTSWIGTNSVTITHYQGNRDGAWQIFDMNNGEEIFIDNITWGDGNNSTTFTLPTGQVAGNWRLMYWSW